MRQDAVIASFRFSGQLINNIKQQLKQVTMKKKILLLMGIFSFGIINAQVGINTNTPQGVLHIDGQGNTSGTSNVSDDVLINTSGNIGLGTLSPTAKIHSVGSSTLAPMRITDTKQGTNYILVSDNAGNASWMEKPVPGGVIYNLTGSAKTTYAYNTYTLVKAMPISETGNYMISLRWWGTSASVAATNLVCAVFYATTSANTTNSWTADQANLKDQAEYCANTMAGAYTCFSSTLFAKATKGQYIKLYIRVSAGGAWTIGSASTTQPLWNPSIVMFRV
ncbi:hypothetical protein SAMN05444362_104175 [Dysgonomonas macrotermitis]|uniref:Uncharacterized protein n=2 Tax=Dysgonomonas macrotermitis TaxID=1346286 RepID=A0A1M4ZSG3_9BACT|nr:hypothetical protein SAMN05444362_104175 [Dysgonomonas macrotermitis]